MKKKYPMVVENEHAGKASPAVMRPEKPGLLDRIGNGLAGSSGWGVIAYGVIGIVLLMVWVVTLAVTAEGGHISSSTMGLEAGHPHFAMLLVGLFCVCIFMTAFMVSCLAYLFRRSFIRWIVGRIRANHGLSYFVVGSVLIAVEAMPYGGGVSILAAVVIPLVGLAGVLCLGLGYRVLWQRAGDVEKKDGPLLTGDGRLSQGLEYALTGKRLWGPFLFFVLAVLTLSPVYTKTPYVLAPDWQSALLIVVHTVLDVLFEVSFLAWLVRRMASGEMLGHTGHMAGALFLLGGVVLQGVGILPLMAMDDAHHPIPLLAFCVEKIFVFLPYVLIASGWMVLARHMEPANETAC